MEREHARPSQRVPPDGRRQHHAGREHRPVRPEPLVGRGDEGPPPGEREQPGLPPALPEADVQSGRTARQPVQQHPQGIGVIGRTHHRHAEIAGGDHEHGQAPPPPRSHQAEAGRHAREVEQEQVGVGAVVPEEHRREEGAERGRDAERLDIDGVGDHGERDRDQRQPDDARRRR